MLQDRYDSEALSEQFRMRKLQVFNWGTFRDLHTINISQEGYLFVGPSGSGKSTLLDAIAALLVPKKWLDFNAAARETDRAGKDRTYASYVRGAWGEQSDKESGDFAIQYLREGSTWSGLALSYSNERGDTVVLAQLFIMKGSTNSNDDVKRVFFVAERELDLSELTGFDLDVKKLVQKLGDKVHHYSEFSPYATRFCRLFNIEENMSLRLLHKTQSAKNLGDLNIFLRDFMLEKPDTFSAADRLVGEFSELNAAHSAVVTAREQVEALLPAREKHNTYSDRTQLKEKVIEIRSLSESYRNSLHQELLKERILELTNKIAVLHSNILNQESEHNNAKAKLMDLESQHRNLGGGQIESWQHEKQGLEKQRDQCIGKLSQVKESCRSLGWDMPETVEEFSNLVNKSKSILDSWQTIGEKNRERMIQLSTTKESLRTAIEETASEIKALRRQPSNIPFKMLELRKEMAQSLKLQEMDIPFVGELIEVRQRDQEWRGAIEKLLRGFAQSILVEERFHNIVNNYANSTYLKGRLVYYVTYKAERNSGRPPSINAVFSKLELKNNVHHKSWLESELKMRYDYECSNTLQSFKNSERAITIEGLIRHNKTRHEKDDRSDINDRRNWILGFDNREKLKLYEKQADDLNTQLNVIENELKQVNDADNTLRQENLICQTLSNITWTEIEIHPIIDRINQINVCLENALKKNSDLSRISKQIDQQKTNIKKLEDELVDSKAELKSISQSRTNFERQLSKLTDEDAKEKISAAYAEDLKRRYEQLKQQPTLENLSQLASRVERSFSDELQAISTEIGNLKSSIELVFVSFRKRWEVASAHLDETIGSAPEYLLFLERLEQDGLPQFEERFFELLNSQSTQNLAVLSKHLTEARKEILERMDLVNESLKKAAFEPGTYLRIQANDKHLEEVAKFKNQLNTTLNFSFNSDREQLEKRFELLQALVKKLSSEDLALKRWKELVLDVRQHVEFIGQELNGNNEIEFVHRSGASKSGGQRQKLATFCLAAALHYQLSRNGDNYPSYAAVVLDEAFDKADSEFTKLAMNVFKTFGFQMIVATPLKSVKTLQSFIGGACFVHIEGRNRSQLLPIEYDKKSKRLVLTPEQTNAEKEAILS